LHIYIRILVIFLWIFPFNSTDAIEKSLIENDSMEDECIIIKNVQSTCAELITPSNNAINVSVNTDINWTPFDGTFFGYNVRISREDNGEIILQSGNGPGNETITPPVGLPENTIIIVDIDIRIDQSNPNIIIDCPPQQFTTQTITQPPECTSLSPPEGSDEDQVILNPTFFWELAPRANNYRLIITETDSGIIVFDNSVGNRLSFTLGIDDQLQPDTLYTTVIIPQLDPGAINFPDGIEASSCDNVTFRTTTIDTTPPNCSILTSPANGSTNVALSPTLTWNPVDNADGYFVTITSDTGILVLDQGLFPGQDNTSTLVIDFDPDTEYCVVIEPFRRITAFNPPVNVLAINCDEDFEICFSTTLGCGPFEDPDTGQIIDLNPRFDDLEDQYILCLNEEGLPLEFTGSGTAFNWLRVTEINEEVISTERNVIISEGGNYRLEVIDEIIIEGGEIICEGQFDFEVNTSELATILGIDILNQSINSQIIINVEGNGDYEFSLGNPDGPYQDSNIFNNVNLLNAIVFVRDRNGCGVVQRRFGQRLGFPTFFTPNQDGINDFWQIRGIVIDGETITQIQIFDRFGKQISDFDPFSRGWDGTYLGNQLPSGGYWYRAFTQSDVEFTGFFALKT